MSDFPANPFNPLAVANAIAGVAFLHNTYPFQTEISPSNPKVFLQGAYQDSRYYLLTNDLVPILRPLESIGVPKPILLFLNAPLQVLIETAYVRQISPGQPVPFRLTFKSPVTVTKNLTKSLLVGFDDAAEDLGVGRPLHTLPEGPFGVGGPTGPVPDPSAAAAVRNPVASQQVIPPTEASANGPTSRCAHQRSPPKLAREHRGRLVPLVRPPVRAAAALIERP